MSKFIDEVAKSNNMQSHKMKLSEEKENVKRTLYNYLYKEFHDAFYKEHKELYDIYMLYNTSHDKQNICYKKFDFGKNVSMQYVDTIYFQTLDKVYKNFQKFEHAENYQDEKNENENSHNEYLSKQDKFIKCYNKYKSQLDLINCPFVEIGGIWRNSLASQEYYFRMHENKTYDEFLVNLIEGYILRITTKKGLPLNVNDYTDEDIIKQCKDNIRKRQEIQEMQLKKKLEEERIIKEQKELQEKQEKEKQQREEEKIKKALFNPIWEDFKTRFWVTFFFIGICILLIFTSY